MKNNVNQTTSSPQSPIRGVWTAIATPFASDGTIDWKAFDRLLQVQAEGEVDGIVVSGTTGETPTLTVQEKISLVRKARAHLPASIRIMAGTGGNNTSQSIELSKLCVDAGADSLLIVTPPYNKPSPAGLKLHYSMISEAVSVPLCLYHVPGRTNQTLSPALIAELTSIPRVTAVKEASGDVALLSRVLQSCIESSILTGDDPTYLASLAVGAKGVISVTTNIFPKAFVAMTRAFHAGKWREALAIHNVLMPCIEILFCESNPGPLKAALQVLDLACNYLRAPLAPVTEKNFDAIKSIVLATDSRLKDLLKSSAG